MSGPSHTLRIPIKEGYTPNIHAQVDLVGATARTDEEGKVIEKAPKRPAFASGTLNLRVPPLERKLSVEAKPRDKALEPGGETIVDVEVRDAQGKPVAGSELAVIVVDESVLALTNYRIGNPIEAFYAERGSDVSDYHLREDIVLASSDDFVQVHRGFNVGGGPAGTGGGDSASMPAAPPPPKSMMAKRALKDALITSIGGRDTTDDEQIA
jgi:uncharacterized protein YfaS (alpha-2-macroglobulin family)